jgi:threonine aldolase
MRFISAQLEAYVQGGLWLRLAGQANAMARRLADGIAGLPGVRLSHPVEINEIFAELPRAMIDGLLAAGFGLYDRGGGEVRLVTAFNNTAEQIEAFVAAARRFA